jgi:small-conductance mechanosensitive channel
MAGETFFTSPWFYGPLILLAWVAVALFVKRVALNRMTTLAMKTKYKFDDVIINSLNLPLNLVILLVAIMILERIVPLSPRLDSVFDFGFKTALIIAVIYFVDRLLVGYLGYLSNKYDFLQASYGVFQGLTRGVIIGIGILILLDSMGVSITPLLASLGIGSLAVALALQDTLANFFAGLHIILDKPVRVGHFIRLDSGQEGYVTKVGWRTTWIRMLPNNVVVIPNKDLANSVITNYYLPEQELAVLVQVGVHYNSDLEQVERVTCKIAKEIMQTVPGGVPEFDPFIRYHTFADSSINFTVILRAKEFVDNYLIKHEFIKRLHQAYKQEGITIPFPIRTLDISRADLEYLKAAAPPTDK